jgi:hypothetical protein
MTVFLPPMILVAYTLAAGDGGKQDQDEDYIQVRSTRKRQHEDFPWSKTHDWTKGDPPKLRSRKQCVICKNCFLALTNAQGWKVHLKTQHRVHSPAAWNSDADVPSASSAPPAILELHQSIMRPASSTSCGPQVCLRMQLLAM